MCGGQTRTSRKTAWPRLTLHRVPDAAPSEGHGREDDLEAALFAFLCRKYVQHANYRQKAMGLQYTTAETHDLAVEVAGFIRARAGGVTTDPGGSAEG